MIKHLNIKIYGRVQKVFFRANTVKKAKELKLTGFVKNEKDGSVHVEVEGEENVLEEFISWCRKGPRLAKVEKVDISESTVQNFSEFMRL